ncbi:hypothetical protein JDV02_004756 [Purpureocillium takamizusanense]|uniref:RING-type domain-containing protein n=1 Tax=Purpureocillium takamizusanense TaxID=2060973 RepID=A0A9Q8QF36_9HYPO|nr:uncharacterized protein JDV02_004756 [Purpureocillium takamizusanense]UNI18490.1 hypothetical protein JDV02_004756 [Purpureocillium takamizusanense]
MAQRNYHRALACLRCRGNLADLASAALNPCTKQYVFPCGHILCQRCFDTARPFTEASLCNRCNSCIWRRSAAEVPGPIPEGECAHQVAFSAVAAGGAEKPPIPPGVFKLGCETVGKACGRCVAERLLRRLTAEARGLGVPGTECAVACLGTGMDALHGWVAPEMTIEEFGAGGAAPLAMPELRRLAEERMPELVAGLSGLRAERGWRPQLLMQGVVFRVPYAGVELPSATGGAEGEGEGEGEEEPLDVEAWLNNPDGDATDHLMDFLGEPDDMIDFAFD